MLVLGLFLFVAMLIVGGMAVDIARHERSRALLQTTLDRAVLAASSLDQTADAAATRTIVQDYFRKAGIGGQLGTVTTAIATNSRQVGASATASLRTDFMRLVGVRTLDIAASAAAIESVQDIEIVLVLDVSGSMARDGQGNPVQKLANLKTAANNFVDTVLASDSENRISIAIVPFNGQVNLGAALRARYAVTDTAGVPGFVTGSNCVDLPASVYGQQSIDRNLSMPATAWVDTFSFAEGLGDANGDRVPDSMPNGYVAPVDNAPRATNRWCPDEPGNVVLPPTRAAATLHSRINGLVGVGATSINAGMRWGLTFLDPTSEPVFRNAFGSAAVAGRPLAFGTGTLKVVVLMTDGEHFEAEQMNTGYRAGQSPVYRSALDGALSIRIDRPSTNYDYWVPHRSYGAGEWRTGPWNAGGGVSQLTWAELWGGNNTSAWPGVRASWVAWQLYARALGGDAASRLSAYKAQMDAFRSLVPVATMDAQLQAMCHRAVGLGIVVYGIAFEAPQNGQAAIRRCVSDDGQLASSNYFDASGLQIDTVFRTIAAQINALRLMR